MMGMHRLPLVLALALALAVSGLALAAPTPPGARAFGIARLKYGGGGDWYGNQTSLKNLMAALRERMDITIAGDDAAVVEPGSATLFQYRSCSRPGTGTSSSPRPRPLT
jgi:hypothetical protein